MFSVLLAKEYSGLNGSSGKRASIPCVDDPFKKVFTAAHLAKIFAVTLTGLLAVSFRVLKMRGRKQESQRLRNSIVR